MRRLQRQLEQSGDGVLVHGLRGKPSNRRLDATLRQRVLDTYRQRFADFGPTFACEKLAELQLLVSPETLRRWLLAEGLWQRQRRKRGSAADRVAPVLVSWCRSMLPSTIGWRGAASNSC